MSTEEMILAILSEGKLLKGREISLLLASKFGLTIDKSEVNSLLYRSLRDKAEQNKNYQWTLKAVRGPKKVTDVIPTSSSGTPLSKLTQYYLECISKDMDEGISVFARSHWNLDYSQLDSFPVTQHDTTTISSHLIDKVRKAKNNLVFKLGYPILVRSIHGKDSKQYFFAEPLFVFTVDSELALKSALIKITDDEPTLNPKAIGSIAGTSSNSEILLEMVGLYEELGFNNDPEDKPGIEELFLRLEKIRSVWKWKEGIRFEKLSREPLAAIQEDGIYNSAAVFIGEKSKYTVGLEKDLSDLLKVSEQNYHPTALGSWISNEVGVNAHAAVELIEPIQLNDEQRLAVKKGLSAPLTVVTGPPGTGKSQVVTSLIVNAVYQGQTVLFSSKNNKAVDVVNDRVNALSSKQVMLRLGAKFQLTLSEYLSSLLSTTPSEMVNTQYQEAKSIHEELISTLALNRKKQEAIIERRNTIDKMESGLEQIREEFGKEFFAHCESLQSESTHQIQSQIDATQTALQEADKKNQSLFMRICWGMFRKKRFQNADSLFKTIQESLGDYSVPPPRQILDDATIEIYSSYLNRITAKQDAAKRVWEYFTALHNLGEGEDLFSLSVKENQYAAQILENATSLWNYWLQLLPNRLRGTDRKVIGDYISVLNLIVAAEQTNQSIDRGVWSKYYSFLPKIKHILSCWAVTSLSARGRIPLEPGFFDVVIIDEASQCDIASALPLLYRAKRAVIIGDDKQLTHISTISETQDIHLLEKHGLEDHFMSWSYAANSLFRLATSKARSEDVVVLRDHHRSHGDIISYSNQYFYENNLRIATVYENLKSLPDEPAVRWIDVKGHCKRPESGSTYNELEALQVVQELSRLIKNGYKGTIGVVTPFKAQFLRIRDIVKQNNDLQERLMLRNFLCDSVHGFQGDEKDLIIFSPVVSDGLTEGSISFLKRTGNLFNVAITRARASLIIVGDKQACHNSGIQHYKGFVEYVNELKQVANIVAHQPNSDFGPRFPNIKSKYQISDWEKTLYETLYQAGIHTIPQYQVGQYALDLALFDGHRKLNIEVDGEKYHRNWDGELLKRDLLRTNRLIELGWDVQRFWVYQIRDNMKQCIEKIKKWKE